MSGMGGLSADAAWALARLALALALACVAALMVARWNHEKQLASSPRGLLERKPAEARAGALRGTQSDRFGWRLPVISHPLYWLGLTTSAALAGQAIAALLAVQ
jgi:hypothetical protein